MDDTVIKKMIEELDFIPGSDGLINYSEFLAATLDTNTFLVETKLKAAFALFDTDGTGQISKKNL